jgi:3-dehydro-L-gulonate 2-dehydrogenase
LENASYQNMRISFEQMKQEFHRILLALGFPFERAELCARIFTENSRDGVYSHGLNRFPVFVQLVKDGFVDVLAEPEQTGNSGLVEHWDGHLAPGMYTATRAMESAIELAKKNGLGAVLVKNTNHWMRGGTYGRLAASAGCVGICSTNTIANMPPWEGLEPRLGNNPLVIAIPYKNEPIVLDMAMSQFSYGKLQEYKLKGELLPVAGGYDQQGELTRDPEEISRSKRTLPIGFWKGSGLSLVLDILISSLSGGNSVAKITSQGREYGLSQFFLCFDARKINESIIEEILEYTRSAGTVSDHQKILYPGENSFAKRITNEEAGIPVDANIWQQVLQL